jgi:hypothetical protein
MTKRYLVTATVTSEMYAVVQVPDDWTAEDVYAYYKVNGACGEFIEDPFGHSWEWGHVTPDTEMFDDVTATLTDEDKVN